MQTGTATIGINCALSCLQSKLVHSHTWLHNWSRGSCWEAADASADVSWCWERFYWDTIFCWFSLLFSYGRLLLE